MASKQRAVAELTADDSGLQRGLGRAEKRLSAFQKFNRYAAKGLASAGSKIMAGFAGGAVLGGTALLVNEARKTIDFERDLSRLSITARGALGPMDAFRDKVFQVSSATGVAREEVLKGAAAFVALTGDGKTASASMELFAKVAKGTGASMEDISASAAAMVQNLKIDPADLEKAFSIMIAGGKAGSVELRDMAGLLASLAPLAATFAGGSGTTGLAELAAGLQLTRQGFGSASEAANGLERIMGSIVQGAKRFKKGGVNVFSVDKDGNKSLRSFREIVEAIGESKLMKDPTKLRDAFGSKEAYQAFLQLTKVKGAWADLSDETLKANDTAEDYEAFRRSAAGQMEEALNALKNAVAQTFTPEVIAGFVLALKDSLRFVQDLILGMRGLGEELENFFGGDESKVSRMEGDDALDNAMGKGFSLDRIEKLTDPNRTEVDPLAERELQEAAGTIDTESIRRAAGRRRAAETAARRNDNRLQRGFAGTISRDLELAERATSPAVEPGPVQIHVLMDPSTTDLKGKIANHRGHGIRP